MQDKIYQKLISGEESYKYTYEELYKEIEDYGYDNYTVYNWFFLEFVRRQILFEIRQVTIFWSKN